MKKSAAILFLILTSIITGRAATAAQIDATAFGDRSTSATTIATGAFSTTAANELLLAFVSADGSQGVQVNGVSGAGLTWTLVVRSNAQPGSAEIWRAFATTTLSNVTVTATLSQSVAASITVVSFSGVDTTGTGGSGAIGATAVTSSAAGAPVATLVTTRANSWVFGVGTDWSNAVSRTVGANQTMVHQYLATVGDTYWVQRMTSATAASGTSVTINDTAPAGDRYDLAIVEIRSADAVDTTPPTATMTAPSAGATVSGSAVTVSATATDNVAVVGVQFKLDGVNLGAEDTTSPYSVVWNSTTAVNGSHSLSAVARDAAGNSTGAVAVSVSVANDTTPPTVITVTPAAGATNVSPSTALTAAFSEAMNAATVTTATVLLRDPGSVLVPATIAYNAATNTATLTPSAALGAGLVYTATVKSGAAGVKDAAGNALVADFVWTFTTVPPGPTCPCGIWSATATPGPVLNDPAPVELGVKFRSDSAGFITGIRFYKYAQNTGAHVANLWTTSGTLLGTAVFVSETGTGWQLATFGVAIPIAANTTYIASYFTSAGFYAFTGGGLTSAVDNPPLHALADAAAAGNGVFKYGAASVFPDQNGAGGNYWVDVVFNTTVPVDSTPPTVTSTLPANGATGVPVTTTVTVKFSEAIDAATLTAANVQLRDPSNAIVAAVLTYSAPDSTVTLAPSLSLQPATTYTATVKGGASGVKDLAGNALVSDRVWTFATPPAGACPCSIWSMAAVPGPMINDANPVELGVKFRTDTSGTITGLRFYKYGQNVGPHVGNLWTVSGTLLGTAAFSNESASGWQEATFTTPIAVTANTTYVASYFAPAGSYAHTASGLLNAIDNAPLHALSDAAAPGNGVFKYGPVSSYPDQSFSAGNYWVDVVLATAPPADTTAPTVAMTAPAAAATVSGTVTVTAGASDNVGVAGVQFLLDGAPLGAEDTASPFSFAWNSIAGTNGSHSLSAIARDAAGNHTTAAAVTVTVNNDLTAPTVSLTAPAAGTVSNSIAVTATAGDNVAVAGVQFLLDGAALGAEDTTSPYSVTWNTATSPNGVHTLAARARDAAGNQTTSAAVTVTVSNGAVSTLAIDATAFGDSSTAKTTTATSAFSTTAANELLLAFVSADDLSGGNTVTGISGGGLTWVLAVRTNVQRGTSEIWRAFAPSTLTNVTVTATLAQAAATSLTVVTFKGADTAGTAGSGAIGATRSANAASGAPSASLTTTRANSWVFGVGNDWDSNTSRTVGAAQTMVHQYLATVGDTMWVQRTTATTPGSGTVVTINDTAPTADRYNLSLVEVLPGGPDLTPPTVTATSPSSGATGVAVTTTVTATFSEAVDPATVSLSTFELRDPANALVAATVAYDTSTRTATLTPSAALTAPAVYSATVKAGVADLAGNPMTAPVAWSFTTSTITIPPAPGTSTPILVVTSPANPFTQYYTEILRAEGLNEFGVLTLSQVTAAQLANYDAVVLGEQALTSAQVTMFTTWVQNGGNLLAMRPDKKLASLLGVSDAGATLSNSYLRIDSSQAAGAGLVTQPIQYHGASDQYVAAGAATVATLYTDPTHPTAFPAVTLNTVGSSGGHAAAFTFDLARSVVYTRQGNPAWSGQERDGTPPVRSDDLFYGAKAGDIQDDWVEFDNVGIPQADEQQRLFANLLLTMNSARRPLPRLWYFPNGRKAAVIMTNDDHASPGNIVSRFNQYLAQSPGGCVVANWDCVRATAYLYPVEPLTNTQLVNYVSQGFEFGVHVTMDPSTTFGCGNDYTATTLQNAYTTQIAQFKSRWPGAPAQVTHRMHCLMWSDWLTQAQTELGKGIRLDVNYYYWPPDWINNRPGMFTGSGIPMRYAGTDGTIVDVFQAPTQMTDESGQTFPFTIDTLLDNALGPLGYYGAFVANMHADAASSPGSDAIVASALARGVAVVSAKQMLTWLDGRYNSQFGSIAWSANALTFSIAPGTGANGLQVMIPVQAGALHLSAITLGGAPVTSTVQTIKGISYAFVTAAAGQYRATYVP